MGCLIHQKNVKVAPNDKRKKKLLTFLIHCQSSIKAPAVTPVFVHFWSPFDLCSQSVASSVTCCCIDIIARDVNCDVKAITYLDSGELEISIFIIVIVILKHSNPILLHFWIKECYHNCHPSVHSKPVC